MVDEVDFSLVLGDVIDFHIIPEVDKRYIPFLLNFEEQIHHFCIVVAIVFYLCVEHNGTMPSILRVSDYVLDCTYDGLCIEIIYVVASADFTKWHFLCSIVGRELANECISIDLLVDSLHP